MVLPQYPECRRGHAKHGAEHSRKMQRVLITNLLGDFFDEYAGSLKALGGMVHFEPEQVLVGRLMTIAAE